MVAGESFTCVCKEGWEGATCTQSKWPHLLPARRTKPPKPALPSILRFGVHFFCSMGGCSCWIRVTNLKPTTIFFDFDQISSKIFQLLSGILFFFCHRHASFAASSHVNHVAARLHRRPATLLFFINAADTAAFFYLAGHFEKVIHLYPVLSRLRYLQSSTGAHILPSPSVAAAGGGRRARRTS